MSKTNLKLIVVTILLSMFITGCAVRNESNINTFVITNNNINNKSIKINFKGVYDKRDTKIVSTIINDKETTNQYSINVDLKRWYEDAFQKELKSHKMYALTGESNIDITVNIKQLKASYEKFTIKKDNLKANVSIELIAKKDDTTHTININLNQSTYKPLVIDAQSFDSILNEILISSVSQSITKIISKFY